MGGLTHSHCYQCHWHSIAVVVVVNVAFIILEDAIDLVNLSWMLYVLPHGHHL